MFTHRPSLPLRRITTPPLPPGVTPGERLELAAAKARVRPKWAALDAMIDDYRAADRQLER